MDKKLSLYELLSKADQSKRAEIFNHYITKTSNELKKPYSMQLELLPLCNFKCSFCYVRKTKAELREQGQRILRFSDWKYYIDESVKLGVTGIAFSGGECTLHPDFSDIYKYAYNLGMRIGLITNGSCITDDIFRLFEDYPPLSISITLYGMSKETYEKTCGNGDAFEKVINNIEKLAKRGFNVSINYTAGKDNFCDMDAVLDYARKKQLAAFPNDSLMTGENCQHIVDSEIVDHKEFRKILNKHFSIVRKIPFEEYEKNFFNSYYVQNKPHEKGLLCNAGKSMITVNWQGKMTPCVSFYMFQFDPHEFGFENCWNAIKDWGSNVPLLQECEFCIFQTKCALCPALHYQDTGEFGKVSPRLCFKQIYPEEAKRIQAVYDSQHSTH